MEEQTKGHQDNREFIEVQAADHSYLRVGDLELEGECSTEALVNAVVWLLQQEEVKTYLGLQAQQKIARNYVP